MAPNKPHSPGSSTAKGLAKSASGHTPKKHATAKSKHSPVKPSSTRDYAHRIFTTAARGDIWLAKVMKAHVEEGVTVVPLKCRLKKHKSFAKEAQINYTGTFRDPSGENKPMMQGSKSRWPQDCFVKLVKPEEDNTTEARKQWGNPTLTTAFNKVGQDVDPLNNKKFHFQVSHKCAGDTAPPTLLPLSHYLLNESIIAIIKLKHPTLTLEEIAQDDEIISTYFGADNVQHYRSLLLGSLRSSSPSSSSSSDA